MLRLMNRINNIGLKDNEIRQTRLNIEQPHVNNTEQDQTPIKIIAQNNNNNLINNRLLFKSTSKFLINPVNKKKLTRQKPVESVYNDRKENFKNPSPSKRNRRHSRSRNRINKYNNPIITNSSFGYYGNGTIYPFPYIYTLPYVDQLMPIIIERPILIEKDNKDKKDKKDNKDKKVEHFNLINKTNRINLYYIIIIIIIIYCINR